jgi:hypothetical protein
VHPSHYSYRWLRHRSTVLYSVTSCSALTTQPCMLLPRRAHGGPFLGPAPRESPGICAGCHGKRACVLCGGLWACRCREKAPHESACTGPSRAHGRPSDRPLLALASNQRKRVSDRPRAEFVYGPMWFLLLFPSVS